MTWVKVCGMRTTSDVVAAEAGGADAIGLVLVPSSPRVLEIDQAKELVASTNLPAILLTLDMSPDELVETLGEIGAQGAQPYGANATAAGLAVARGGGMALLPIQVRAPVDLTAFPEDVIPLLDGFSTGALGGTGVNVPQEFLPESGIRFVLAGGLTPDNVSEAIVALTPWGVDASSGLESSIGVKDPALIHAFIEKAKNAHET